MPRNGARRDKALLAAVSEGQDRAVTAALRKQMADIENRRDAATHGSKKSFPTYAELGSPKPLKVEDVQACSARTRPWSFWLVGDKESYVLP